MKRYDAVSEPEENVNILPKTRARSAPPIDNRHDKFQLGTNPMRMTPFEKSRAALEVEERRMACSKYIKGIQGIDGGVNPDDQTKNDNLTCPLNVKSSY